MLMIYGMIYVDDIADDICLWSMLMIYADDRSWWYMAMTYADWWSMLMIYADDTLWWFMVMMYAEKKLVIFGVGSWNTEKKNVGFIWF